MPVPHVVSGRSIAKLHLTGAWQVASKASLFFEGSFCIAWHLGFKKEKAEEMGGKDSGCTCDGHI